MPLTPILVRLRVPLGYALGAGALALARPTPLSFSIGLVLAALGEALRIWASGHLLKGGELTRSGPYAWTRNPLYFGSFLLGLGFSVAAARWEVALVLALLFAGVYLPVMRAEAARLAERYPEAYAEYARVVPLLIPSPWRLPALGGGRSFSWQQARANREHLTVAGWVVGAALLWWRMN